MPETNNTEPIQTLPVDLVLPSAYQMRKTFDSESLKGLADSMAKEGLIQPITVRERLQFVDGAKVASAEVPVNGSQAKSYELISGERRLRAAKSLGWKTIEARVIGVVSEAAAASKGLVENLQREDLDPLEEAEGFNSLNKLDPEHWTQEEIGKVTGKSRVYVSRSIGILSLTTEVQGYVRQRTLSREHAIELSRLLSTKVQLRMALNCVTKGLSVKILRSLVDRQLEGKRGRLGLPGNAELKDPLKQVWQKAKEAEDGQVGWKVDYRMGAWSIAIRNDFKDPRAELRRFLLKLADAIGGSEKLEYPGAAAPSESGKVPRFPANAAERASLEAIGEGGPGAVYAWIFGPDNRMAKLMSASSWGELGATGPGDGVEKILKAIQTYQDSEPDAPKTGGPHV